MYIRKKNNAFGRWRSPQPRGWRSEGDDETTRKENAGISNKGTTK